MEWEILSCQPVRVFSPACVFWDDSDNDSTSDIGGFSGGDVDAAESGSDSPGSGDRGGDGGGDGGRGGSFGGYGPGSQDFTGSVSLDSTTSNPFGGFDISGFEADLGFDTSPFSGDVLGRSDADPFGLGVTTEDFSLDDLGIFDDLDVMSLGLEDESIFDNVLSVLSKLPVVSSFARIAKRAKERGLPAALFEELSRQLVSVPHKALTTATLGPLGALTINTANNFGLTRGLIGKIPNEDARKAALAIADPKSFISAAIDATPIGSTGPSVTSNTGTSDDGKGGDGGPEWSGMLEALGNVASAGSNAASATTSLQGGSTMPDKRQMQQVLDQIRARAQKLESMQPIAVSLGGKPITTIYPGARTLPYYYNAMAQVAQGIPADPSTAQKLAAYMKLAGGGLGLINAIANSPLSGPIGDAWDWAKAQAGNAWDSWFGGSDSTDWAYDFANDWAWGGSDNWDLFDYGSDWLSGGGGNSLYDFGSDWLLGSDSGGGFDVSDWF